MSVESTTYRTQNIVCFHACFFHYLHLHEFQQVMQNRHLRGKVIGHFFARCLVIGVNILSEIVTVFVESDDKFVGLVSGNNLQQNIDKTVHRIDVFAVFVV